MNKKLIFNSLIFIIIGIALFTITYFLNIFNVISGDTKLINSIIYIISSAICFCYYLYINKNCSKKVETLDCVLLFIIAVTFCWPTLYLSLKIAGIHLSVSIFWASGILLIFANSLLQRIDYYVSDYSNNTKYQIIITKIKEWKFSLVLAAFLLGIVNLITPLEFSYNPLSIG